MRVVALVVRDFDPDDEGEWIEMDLPDDIIHRPSKWNNIRWVEDHHVVAVQAPPKRPPELPTTTKYERR